jgi:uncharacterized protein
VDLSLALVLGFLSGLHCVGMCGALIAGYSVQRGSGQLLTGVASHLSYNGGRLLSYAFLGAVAGAVGSGLGSLKMLGPWFSIAAGFAMFVLGLYLLGVIPAFDLSKPAEASWLRKLHLRTVADLLTNRTRESAFYVGLLTPFLPCGVLYAMILKAAETGNAGAGALTMFAFGAGTAPALLLAGLATTYINIWLRLYATRLAGVMVVLMGVLLVFRGIGRM